LDSVLIGSTPFKNLELSPGSHHIEALSPYSGLWNATNITQNFVLKAGQDTTIKIRFQNKIKINSVPYHARLILQNNVLGFTPLDIPFEENKGQTFTLEKAGFHSFRFVLEEPKSHLFTLEPIDLSEKESNSFGYSLLHKKLKNKFLFLSGTVASHWLAFYFKNIADNKYKKYKSTADPVLMDKYWHDTQKFDRYSDISLGVSYALLSGLIYTVLRN
jgi:hypothetical protein